MTRTQNVCFYVCFLFDADLSVVLYETRLQYTGVVGWFTFSWNYDQKVNFYGSKNIYLFYTFFPESIWLILWIYNCLCGKLPTVVFLGLPLSNSLNKLLASSRIVRTTIKRHHEDSICVKRAPKCLICPFNTNLSLVVDISWPCG